MTSPGETIFQVKGKLGSYKIQVSGNILSLSGDGPWDDATSERYNEDIRKAVAIVKPHPWAFIGYLRGSAVLTPSVESMLQETIAWRAKNGMALCALVIEKTTVPELVRTQFERIYENAGVTYGIFKNTPAALIWLSKRGFTTT